MDGAFLDKNNQALKKKNGKSFVPQHYTQRALYDTATGQFFYLILLNSLLLVEDDICIKVKSVQTPSSIESFKFRFWLNAKFVKSKVGKVAVSSVSKQIQRNQFIHLKEVLNVQDREVEVLTNLQLPTHLIEKHKTRIQAPRSSDKKGPKVENEG